MRIPSLLFAFLKRLVAVCLVLMMSLPALAQMKEVPITTNSEEAKTEFVQARTLFENLRFDEARDGFDRALQADPEFALAYLYRAITAQGPADFNANLEKAEQWMADASKGEQWLIKAYRANADDHPEVALETLKDLAARYPEDKRVRMQLGTVYYSQEMYDKAVASFDKALELDADYAPAYNLKGYSYMAAHDYPMAETAFSKYVELLPDEANPHDSYADLLSKMGRHDKAIAHYREAVNLDPKFNFSQLKIGTSHIFLGKYDQAREAFRRAEGMVPDPYFDSGTRRMVARSYVYEGNLKKALEQYQEALDHPDIRNIESARIEVLREMSRIQIEADDLKSAETSLSRIANEVGVSDLNSAQKQRVLNQVLYHRTMITALEGDFTKAGEMADDYKHRMEAYTVPAAARSYYDLLGYVYFQKGDFNNALAMLEQGDMENPYTLYLMGVSQSNMNNRAEARTLFQKVSDLNEDSIEYAMVRSKAMSGVKRGLTTIDEE